ncbi:MAG TPA: hypothetical protein VFS19_03835 [Planctomycetota bacterium]|nr:hypothetical protein [Planctomycetota bacterium]
MKLWPLLVLLAVQESPLAPFPELAKKLDAGSAEFLKGTAPAEAWQPWPMAKGHSETDVRKGLADAGVKKLSSLGFEFELHFYKDGKPVAALRSFVYVEGAETSFLTFDFKPEAGGLESKALAMEKFSEFHPGLGAAVKSLLEEIKAKKEKAVRFAEIEKVAKRCVFDGLVESAKKQIAEDQAAVKEACEKLSKLDYSEIRLRMDDCPMLALAAEDKPVAVLNLEITAEDGKPALALGRFKPFKKR